MIIVCIFVGVKHLEMKIIKIPFRFLLLFFGLIFINSASAQDRVGAEQILAEEVVSMNDKYYADVADNYLRYLNEKNLEGILSLYADNATVEDPVGSEVVEGMAALRKFYSGAVNIDLTLTRTGPVRIAGIEIAFPFQLKMSVDGTLMITDIIDVFRFDDAGKIVSMRALWGPSNRRPATE